MKHRKKLIAILLAAGMVLGQTQGAFAAPSPAQEITEEAVLEEAVPGTSEEDSSDEVSGDAAGSIASETDGEDYAPELTLEDEVSD